MKNASFEVSGCAAMKNSVRGDSSTGSELKAVEEACREASRTVEPCELCVLCGQIAIFPGRPSSVHQHELLFGEVLEYLSGVVIGSAVGRGQNQLRVRRGFIRIIYSRKAFDLASSRFTIHAFKISLLAHLQRRVHEDLDEPIVAHEVSHLAARRAIGTNSGGERHSMVSDDLRCNEADPANIRVAIFFAKSQTFG